MKNNSGIEVFEKYAVSYQDKFMNLDLYNDTYDALLDHIKLQDADVLELGCGPGNITKYLLSERGNLKVLAIDLSPKMIQLARANNPTAHLRIMDCRDILQLKNKFDVIINGFCTPYLSKSDCTKLISDSAAKLQKNGLFYFSTIEGDYNKSGFEFSSNGQDKCYIYYYDELFLRTEMENNGFELLNVFRKKYPRQVETETHLIIIAQKKS